MGHSLTPGVLERLSAPLYLPTLHVYVWHIRQCAGLLWGSRAPLQLLFLLAGSASLACSLSFFILCQLPWPELEELVGRWGLLYCEPCFRKSWIYAFTLERNLEASDETKTTNAMASSVSLLPGTFPHVYKKTCTGVIKAALVGW